MEYNFKCPICGKEFSSSRSLGTHIGHHNRSVINKKDRRSKSKECPSCKNKAYTCICGKSFFNKQSYASHCSHCEMKRGKKVPKRGSNIKDWWESLKITDNDKYKELRSKISKSSAESSLEKNGEYHIVTFNKSPSKSRDLAHKKQSETRKNRYLSGDLTPAKGIGIGYGSYFNGKFLRSSYELIYAAFLYINSIPYEYESIRVKYNNKIYISDFLIEGCLIEVKGRIKEIPKIKLAFESNGYKIRFLGPSDIHKIKVYLRRIICIDKLLDILRYSIKNRYKLYWCIDKESMKIKYDIISDDLVIESSIL